MKNFFFLSVSVLFNFLNMSNYKVYMFSERLIYLHNDSIIILYLKGWDGCNLSIAFRILAR